MAKDRKTRPVQTDSAQWWKEALFGLSPHELRKRKERIDKTLDEQVRLSGSTRRKA
jgi:hypothetical protein